MVLAVPAAGTANVPRALDSLRLKGFSDLAVDSAHEHVLVSQGQDGRVAVADIAGQLTSTIPGTGGTYSMALSQDGTTWWLATTVGHVGRIEAVDAVTLSVRETYPATGCAASIAELAGTVFYAGPCPHETGWAEIYALDPATGESTPVGGGLASPEFLTDPARPNDLFAYETGSSSPWLVRLDWHADTDGPDGPEQAALERVGRFKAHQDARAVFLPGGDELVTAEGDIVSADTMTGLEHRYRRDPQKVAGVAAGRDGTVAFTSINSKQPLTTYAPGWTSPLHRYDFRNTNSFSVFGDGVGFSDTRMYVVRFAGTAYDPRRIVLRAIAPVAESHFTLRLDRTTYRCGATARLSIRLVGPTSWRRIAVYATQRNTASMLVKKLDLPDSGRATVAYRLPKATTFTVTLLDPDDRVSGRIKAPTERC